MRSRVLLTVGWLDGKRLIRAAVTSSRRFLVPSLLAGSSSRASLTSARELAQSRALPASLSAMASSVARSMETRADRGVYRTTRETWRSQSAAEPSNSPGGRLSPKKRGTFSMETKAQKGESLMRGGL